MIDLETRKFTDDEIMAIIVSGYEQVSHKHRHLARLPPGESAIEAMAAADPRHADDWRERGEAMCAAHYRRVYAEGEDAYHFEMPADFKMFKALGGRTA